DGFPDLYVCQYVDWSFDNHPACLGPDNRPEVCPPKMFRALPHMLYKNRGDGTFTDVSRAAGLREPGVANGMGLGVLIADVDGAGKPDIYVANDTTGNFLYLNGGNRGRIKLRENGLAAGVARDDRGVPTGSAGVDAGDYDGTGRPSLWITNFQN